MGKYLINLTDVGDCDGAGCSVLTLLSLRSGYNLDSPITMATTLPVNRNRVESTIQFLLDNVESAPRFSFPSDMLVKTRISGIYSGAASTLSDIILTFTDIPVTENVMKLVEEFASKCKYTVTPYIIDHHGTNTDAKHYLNSLGDGTSVWKEENVIVQAKPCALNFLDVPQITNFSEKRLRSATLLYANWLESNSLLKVTDATRIFAYEISQYDTFEFDHYRDIDTHCKNPDGYTLLFNNVLGFDLWVDRILSELMYPNKDIEKIDKDTYEELKCPRMVPSYMVSDVSLLVNIREKKYQQAKRHVVKAKYVEIESLSLKDYTVGLLIDTVEVSYIGNRLCKEFPELDFVMFLSFQSLTISMRTIRDDINLSEFAKSIGGGGHPKAAGAPLKVEQAERLLELYHASFNEERLCQ